MLSFSKLPWCMHSHVTTQIGYVLRGHWLYNLCNIIILSWYLTVTVVCWCVTKWFPLDVCVFFLQVFKHTMSKLTTVIAVRTADVHRCLNAACWWQSPTPSPRPCLERGQETSPRSSRGPNPWAKSQRGSRVRRDGLSGRGESGEIGRDLSNWSYGARTDVYGHVFLDGDGELFSLTHRHRAKPERKTFIFTLIYIDVLHPKRLKIHRRFHQSHRRLQG